MYCGKLQEHSYPNRKRKKWKAEKREKVWRKREKNEIEVS
jgi:hypothetical protein